MNHIIRAVLLTLASSAALYGSIVTVDITQSNGNLTLSLDPAGGVLYGNVGSTVGWGFQLTTDANYGVSVVSTDFCAGSGPYPSPCTAGLYTDLIGYTNSVFDNAGDAVLDEAYDPSGPAGFGSFLVQSAPVQANLVLVYFLTDASGNEVGTTNSIATVAATVAPNPTAAPEPSSWILAGSMIILFGVYRRYLRPAGQPTGIGG